MKQTKLSLVVMIASLLLFAGCGNRELKKDAARIGDAMCRNIEIMNKMKSANPADSAVMQNLRSQANQLQNEMTIVYREFNDKYSEKIKDQKFTKKFNRELRKAMLDCPSLSKKDRELFEQELKE